MTARSSWSRKRSSSLLPLLLAAVLACSGLGFAYPVAAAVATPIAEPWVGTRGAKGDLALVERGATATIVYASQDARVGAIAARDLAADIERVTGRRPRLQTGAPARGAAVLIGTLGRSPLIDQLAASGKLDAGSLRGAWESFVIATVEAPMPGLARALVIAGSDPRGTAFGVYELSQAIGVSPWYWWADVHPEHKDALFVKAGTRRFGPPSVKYRGIFLNDEDWGLQPWAARTFEPENGGIGPKTYGRIFELLLRLKANTLWPAMHAVTRPFNDDRRNAALADDYAIVMGSSHAEPMLRNNVGEWKDKPENYNYLSNRDGVLGYWEQRLAANGGYQNIYTIGMRGIHDSQMQGPKTDPERISMLQQVFADQRALLAKYVRQEVERVPQIFCAYKEVLPLYRKGLQVPDDVTIVWPDDNFGYIRGYPNDAERARAGGMGIYYHLSYLGAPLSYLWLGTTPPALVWEEMSKAYDAGARTVWIANVGDLKPSEAGTELFLQMAWDIARWDRNVQKDYLRWWAAREFGAAEAESIAAVMDGYYRLNYQRKPEHLQWWLPREAPRASPLPAPEAERRLRDFSTLRQDAERVQARLPAARRDAYFELVGYPVAASALANQRYFEGERGNAAGAMVANAALDSLNALWNTSLAKGKWKYIMSPEPADQQWRSMRIAKWEMPAAQRTATAAAPPASDRPAITIEAEDYSASRAGAAASWQAIPGLGRSGDGAMGLFPTTMADIGAAQIAADAPRLDYALPALAPGAYQVTFNLIPTHPISGSALRLAMALDGDSPAIVAMEDRDGGPAWAAGVLDATRTVSAPLAVGAGGQHTLRLYGIAAGVLVDRIVIRPDSADRSVSLEPRGR